MLIRPAACAAWALALSLGTAVCAQEAARPGEPEQPPAPPPIEAPPPDDPSDWKIRFEVSAWYVSPGGHVELPNSSNGEMRLDKFNLDTPQINPYLELEVQQDRYGMLASAVVFSLDNRGAIMETGGVMGGIPFSAGERVVSSLDFVTVEAAGWYRFYENPRGPEPGGGFRYRPTWDVMVGGRLYDASFEMEAPAGSASESGIWAEPYVGLRFSMELAETFSVDVTGSFGYFHDGDDRQSVSWDIIAGFRWYPTRNFGVQVGYRQLAFRLHDGDDAQGAFELNGALAGLYAGAVLRF